MDGQTCDNLLLIVVGADLRAEREDRPLAYLLKQRIQTWLDRHRREMNSDVESAVCTDLWYMNHAELHHRPTLSLGRPDLNALSDFYTQVAEPSPVQAPIVIQLDPEFTDLRICIWGQDRDRTAQGLDAFCRDYLTDFLTAVANQVEPRLDD